MGSEYDENDVSAGKAAALPWVVVLLVRDAESEEWFWLPRTLLINSSRSCDEGIAAIKHSCKKLSFVRRSSYVARDTVIFSSEGDGKTHLRPDV